jgi:3-oxoacyl-[acyl-carrier protein] reductase
MAAAPPLAWTYTIADESVIVPDLRDKTVLITGAGRGIGKRLALGFAGLHARVGLLGRSKAEIDLVNLEIEHASGRALRLRCDIRDWEQLAAAADRLQVAFGPAQVLVHAAAVAGPIGPLAAADPKEWAAAIETNLVGAFHACRAVLPGMIAARAGKIILVACTGATAPRPNFSAYAASKAALARLAETLAEEVREYNIQVNCMSPGETYTSMTDEILSASERAGPKEVQAAAQLRSSGGVTLEKQMQLAVFLASEQSNHVSGKLIDVQDDWRRLESGAADSDLFTLRRIQRGPAPPPRKRTPELV